MPTMHPRGSMFLRSHIGTATDKAGAKFHMSLVNGHTPAIECEATGKTYVIDWSDMVKMAIEAGIAKEG